MLETCHPVKDKSDMYRRLAAGEFGNTTPQFFSLSEWEPRKSMSSLWGVRSMVPMDTRCSLDVPTHLIPEMVTWQFGGKANISPMVDHIATLRGHVWDAPDGITLWYSTAPRSVKWRQAFKPPHDRHANRSAAIAILESNLNANSMDDMRILLDKYPGHVIEFTACECEFGVVPGRNAVIWEVRDY